MDYGKISKGSFLLVMASVTLFMVVSVFEEIKSMEEYNYPVMSYRYYETQGSLFLSGSEKVEVIYKTDSETVKKSYSVSSIEIGEKTEVVVYKGENIASYSELYMTKDDYESLLSLKEVKE